MKNKLYDYRGLSLKRIREPKYRHLLLLSGWLVYFTMYFLTENLIPAERCHVIHSVLDDMIPFNEYFVVFYCGWFLLVAGSLAYTLFWDVESFKRLQVFIMVTQAAGMLVYIVYPSIQNLRPAVFPRNNFFTWILGLIYTFDTPTGVFPSLHAAYSFGILSVGLKSSRLSVFSKILLTFIVVMICLAVCFVKQHSALDVIAALPVAGLAEWIVYGVIYKKPKETRKKDKAAEKNTAAC